LTITQLKVALPGLKLIAIAVLLFGCKPSAAQQSPLSMCLDQLVSDRRFEAIRNKVPLGSRSAATPAMMANASLASERERRILADWAEMRSACVKSNSQYGNAQYREPLQAAGLEAENRLMVAVGELRAGKISYGEFNQRWNAIGQELKAKGQDVSRQIQAQREADEQARQRRQEREQMQREIDDANREADVARQQAEQAAAKAPLRRARSGDAWTRRAPVPTYRQPLRSGHAHRSSVPAPTSRARSP
jgi:hypothetical protein